MSVIVSPGLDGLSPRGLFEGLRRRLKKSLGQNFLMDGSVTRTIAVEADRLCPGRILEIGPGAGALTLELVRLGVPVTVLEKDDHCARYIGDVFGRVPNFGVIHGDALEAELPGFCGDSGARPLLVSNLPYNVASQIYFRFVDMPAFIGMILMFQREVADRFVARPGMHGYGALSVISNYYHEIDRVTDVPPESFMPAPKVTSTVLRFVPRRRVLDAAGERKFSSLVHAAFALRRKTLANSLSGYGGIGKADWAGRLADLGYGPTVRAEDLGVSDFIKILGTL